ncbi:DUF6879 family protein [Streptomyces odontomachi]|uniref:DUF6879 family protein n=1 Tax=Streptomyces odontomachi TaxID=2944940 RepID=UPI00210C70C0|nr:DUF6879 family protein [Streptomyces sp. ODS25]
MATESEFDALFRRARTSAVHLEMRDSYMRSDPSFIAWQKGEPPLTTEEDEWWASLVRESVQRGVAVQRARIVSEPISDYVRFEYEATEGHNAAAGEEVRWLPRRRATDLALPGNDFWLFDSRVALIIHLSGDGEWPPGGGIEVTEDPAVVELCAAAFTAVWKRAVPHAEYKPA